MASSSSSTTSTSAQQLPAHLDPSSYPQSVHLPEKNIHLLLTYTPLSVDTHLSHVRSPQAGANVCFTGTTRNTFDNKPVARLSYTCYAPMALRTLTAIAEKAVDAHDLQGVSIAHRLGEVPVTEESIVVAVSAGHRGAAWRAAEEVLEECKARLEIWKREEFEGEDPSKTGEWRANKERNAEGQPVPA